MSFAAAAALSSIGDIGSAMLSQYYNKKNMRDQAQLQYQYAQRYALNSPTWNIQGLRDAGLNPMLAVSNGVNLGANIPNITNSSPNADIDIPAIQALRASKEVEIGEQNATSQSTSAAADMLRAKSDAALKQAQTTETLQRTMRMNQSKYSTPLVRDILGIVDDIGKQSKDIVKEASAYLQSSPLFSPRQEPITKTRHSDEKEKQSNKILDSMWKSNRRGPDGTTVYRKRGDVGGVMHMYR